MTNKELIAEARTIAGRESTLTEGDIGDLVACLADLADALEVATTEPEWEYNTRAANGFLYSTCTLEDAVASVERSKQVYEYAGSERLHLVRHVVRRRPAGPWLPVEGESKP